MRAGRSVLSPRETWSRLEDLAERRPLVAGQRVGRRPPRRPTVKRARRVAGLLGALLAGVAAVGTVGLGVGWLLTSTRFAVAHVEVRGQSRLSPEDITEASGIVPGANLFRLDASAVARRLEALPLIRRAEVIRAFPNRVTLVVEERRPFTLVHAGRLHWIDEQGVGVLRESRAVRAGAPVISGLSADELATVTQAPSDRVATGIALLRTLLRSGSPLLAQISEIDVSRREGPVLYTVEGVEVRLGREEWEPRLARLLGVLTQVASSGEPVISIDLRFRDQVVLKTAAH